MALSPDTEALMLAYVYGELSSDAAHAFEARMAGDAELRAEVEGLLATRDLLAVDARHGAESGLDVPPPHLLDAILRAEALARAPEVRDASLAVRAPRDEEPRGFLHRLSSWLVGGGVVATAAAALLVLIGRDEPPAEAPLVGFEEIAAAAPAAKAEADLAGSQKDALAQAAPAPPPPADNAAEVAEVDEVLPSAEPSAERPAGEATTEPDEKLERKSKRARLSKGAADADAPFDKRAEAPVEELSQKQRAKDTLTYDESEPEPGSIAFGKKRAPRRVSGTSKRDAVAESKPEPKAASPAEAAEGFAQPARGGALLDDAPADGRAATRARTDRAAGPLDDGPLDDGLADDEAKERAAAPEADDSFGLGALQRAGGAAPSVAPVASSAPAAPSSGRYGGPPPLPEVVKQQAIERRSELARERAPAKARAQGLLEAERQKAQAEAEMALASGGHALSEGRHLEALDLFQQAALFDKRARVLGAAPYVGQMDAYLALRRPKDAYALWPLVQRYARSAEDRASGALVAARAAEALGDFGAARRLYAEAMGHASTKAAARKALQRIERQAVEFESAGSAAEASEPP